MIVCEDCGDSFEWSERDQKFYAGKDYEPPKRCKSCRDKRKRMFAEKKARGVAVKDAKKDGRGGQGSHGRSRETVRSGNRR